MIDSYHGFCFICLFSGCSKSSNLEKPGWGKRNPLGFRGTHRFLQPNSLVACEIRPEKSLGKKEEREREELVSVILPERKAGKSAGSLGNV